MNSSTQRIEEEEDSDDEDSDLEQFADSNSQQKAVETQRGDDGICIVSKAPHSQTDAVSLEVIPLQSMQKQNKKIKKEQIVKSEKSECERKCDLNACQIRTADEIIKYLNCIENGKY